LSFNLADLFESVVDVVPEQTAMVCDARRLDYAHLDERANRLAHYLSDAGVRPGDRIGLQLANGSEYIEGMLACFKIRSVPVNVNYRYVGAELRHLYADAGLVGLVFHSRFAPAVHGALEAMAERRALLEVRDDAEYSGIAHDYEAVLAVAEVRRGFGPRSADDLYCVYTGGTTGMPKGVLWRHEDIFFAAMGGGDPMSLGNVIATPEELVDRVMRPGMVALAAPPFMHAAAHWLAFTTLFGGGTLVTLPGGRFDPVAAWRLCVAESVNVLVVVGDAMMQPLLDELEDAGYDVPALMAIGSGGALLSPSTKQRITALLPGRIVVDAFGSSETGQLGGRAPDDDPYGAPRLRVDDRTDVLDDQLRPLVAGAGAVGHLARAGHVPIGYLGDVEKTAATFVEIDGRRWALPGDMARVERDGTIVLLGRGSLCINTGGEKVFPDEVEAVVKSCDGVRDAVVVGLPDDRLGERVVAVVQPEVGVDLDASSVREHCRGRLAGYKVPRQVVVTTEFTRSPAGKADYRWARSIAAAVPNGGAP
jgi:acyl-CoA synthetase (AMP-forming)/AMP-acid ligase II